MLLKTKKDFADAKKLVHLSALSGWHMLLFDVYLCAQFVLSYNVHQFDPMMVTWNNFI